MKPDFKTRTYYMLECDCRGVLDDGHDDDAAKLRRLATAHRKECDATIRLSRTVTLVWKGNGHP